MNDDKLVALIVIGLFLGMFVVLGGLIYGDYLDSQMPQCQEDAVLVGRGDYIEGRWEYLTCGPALDDFAP